MYRANVSNRASLPSSGQLIASTIAAMVVATAILVAAVLPAEYAIDPTGVGRILNLTEMGRIKRQLASEAKADQRRDSQPVAAAPSSPPATVPAPTPVAPSPAAVAQRSDRTVFTLKPNEGIEYKIALRRGGVVEYSWRAGGGVINYDMHGASASEGKEASYKAGRSVSGDDGKLTAGFDGMHGWFWRNRSAGDVIVTLHTSGAYPEIRRMK